MQSSLFWQLSARLHSASKVAAWHLFFSALAFAFAAVLVFCVWYPLPYNKLLGGNQLFLMLAAVDLVCGPLLTLLVFNPGKRRRELCLDLGLIALIQLGALGYGLYSVAQARPVYLVFQVNDFRAVVAAEVDQADLIAAPSDLNELPWFGPKLIGTRSPIDSADRTNATERALQGQEISMRPTWWQDYELNRSQALLAAKPMSELVRMHPSKRLFINTAFADVKASSVEVVWLPLVSRRASDWVVLIDAGSAKVLGYSHIDGYESELP